MRHGGMDTASFQSSNVLKSGNVAITLSHKGTPAGEGGAGSALGKSPANQAQLHSSQTHAVDSPIDLSKKSPRVEAAKEAPHPEVQRFNLAVESAVSKSGMEGSAHVEKRSMTSGNVCVNLSIGTATQKVPSGDHREHDVITLSDEESSECEESDIWDVDVELDDEDLKEIAKMEAKYMERLEKLNTPAPAGEGEESPETANARKELILELQNELRHEESQLLLLQKIRQQLKRISEHRHRSQSVPNGSAQQGAGEGGSGVRHSMSMSSLARGAIPAVQPTTPSKSSKPSPTLPQGRQFPSVAPTISSYSVLNNRPTTTPIQLPPQAHTGTGTRGAQLSSTASGRQGSVTTPSKTSASATAAGVSSSTASASASGQSGVSLAASREVGSPSAPLTEKERSDRSRSTYSRASQQQLQQQLFESKAHLRKQLETSLLALAPERPPPSPSLNFIPAVNYTDFLILQGLEEVVHSIKNPEAQLSPACMHCIASV